MIESPTSLDGTRAAQAAERMGLLFAALGLASAGTDAEVGWPEVGAFVVYGEQIRVLGSSSPARQQMRLSITARIDVRPGGGSGTGWDLQARARVTGRLTEAIDRLETGLPRPSQGGQRQLPGTTQATILFQGGAAQDAPVASLITTFEATASVGVSDVA